MWNRQTGCGQGDSLLGPPPGPRGVVERVDSPPVIEVEGLRKVYAAREPVVAVEEVSFRAEPGRIFGLLGPNGAGKTTTLRVLSTALHPTAGRVVVAGISAAEDPAGVRARIGFLSSSTGLYERLTPREHMRVFGELHGLDGDALEARIEALVAELDLGPAADRRCGLLSTGQRQKASIGRALVHDPPVLIFDEPTSGLDVLVARTLVQRIAALRDARRTILLSTHRLHEAERLCDDVAVLHRGRIRASGTQAELRAASGTSSLEEAFFAVVDATEAAAGEGARDA